MGFNGISGILNSPGEIPWEIVVLFFGAGLLFVFLWGRKTGGLAKFTTLDLIYIGIGAAFAVVWEFYIGAFLGKFIPSNPFFGIGYTGRLIALLIVAGLVRKVGVGMVAMFIFNLLSDLISYGFSGEPMYFMYEMLTYGLMMDIVIAAAGPNLFGIKSPERRKNREKDRSTTPRGFEHITKMPAEYLAAIEGILIGLFWVIPEPLFYGGFISPFLYGGVVDWGKILFDMVAFIPSAIIIGAIGGLITLRIVKAVGQ
ncbi:MAG: hypothetical protein M1460_04300 [Candidatus Thermoplasmatota archaeon]|jgi:hypothetical protein|nr:hypothetical protein [Candidatus Thermoplasmatota archaeon]